MRSLLTGILALSITFSTTYAQDWGPMATISSTMGTNAGRLCMAEASRGDLGCPTYAPSVTAAGHVSVTGNLSASKFIGDGSGLTGISSGGDRITSSTTSVTANSTGFISLTTAGTTTGYFTTAGLLVLPGISTTSLNGISSTNGYFDKGLVVGSTTDATTDVKTLTIRSNGYAGLHLHGDYANTSGEPGGSYVMMTVDTPNGVPGAVLGQTGILGMVNIANQDPQGGSYAGTLSNAMLLGSLYATGDPTWGSLQFGVSRSVVMTLNKNGNVGIGTTAPLTALHVSSDIALNGDSSALFSTNGHNHVGISAADGYDAILSLQEAGSHRWRLSNKGVDDRLVLRNQSTTEVFTVLQSGRVGVGTAAPKATLDVSGSISLGSGAFYLPYKAGSDSLATSYAALKTAIGADSSLLTLTDATDFGLSNQETVLMLADNEVNNDDGFSIVRWNNNGFHSIPFRLRGNGFLGLNDMIAPAYPLDVSGTVRATKFLGDGSSLTNLTGDNLGNHTATQNLGLGANAIVFSNALDDKIYLYSNTYGIGIETNSLTNWSGNTFRWRIGGTSTSAGTERMSLGSGGLIVHGYPFVISTSSGNIRMTSSASGGVTNYIQSGDSAATTASWQALAFGGYNSTIGSATKMLIDDSGSVGIGTTAPLSKLDVNGSATVRGNLSLYSGGFIYGDDGDSNYSSGLYLLSGADTNSGASIYMYGKDVNSSNAGRINIYAVSDTVTTGGIINFYRRTVSGTNTTLLSLRADSTTYFGGQLLPTTAGSSAAEPTYSFNGDPNTGIFRDAPDQLAFSTAGTESMRILASGVVGIGTSVPSSTLTLMPVGASTEVDTAGGSGILQIGPSHAGHMSLDGNEIEARTGSGPATLYLNNNNLGLTNIGGDLYVRGIAYVAATDAEAAPGWTWSGDADTGFWHPAANTIGIVTAASEAVRITSAGRVGINTTAPAVPLHVSGTLRVQNGSVVTCNIGTGTGATSCTSDARLKKDVTPIASALEKIAKLKGITFEWKAADAPKGQHIGVIAQDVEKVFPQAVDTMENGYKSVDYAVLVAPLIEAVKELKADNAELRKEIEALKQERSK